MSEPKVTVSATALRQVLIALTGPSHLIRELQFTRSLPGTENPINTLIKEFNDAITSAKTDLNKPAAGEQP